MVSERTIEMLGNAFVRVDRKGRIVKPNKDIGNRTFEKADYVDLGSMHLPDPNSDEVTGRPAMAAVNNTRAEEAAHRVARASKKSKPQ